MKTNQDEKVYLKPNIVAEPLFLRWYAWSHLISPVTAALNIKERYNKIIRSFLQNPQIHEVAVKTPGMRGGPFIDYNKERVNDIRGLEEDNSIKQQKMLVLADAIHELNDLLQNEAQGSSLDPLYQRIPEVLKGYVELVYDLNNNPSFRILEPLLYESDFYDESFQSILLREISSDDERSFVLSTPRLDDKNTLHCQIPFKNETIDNFFRTLREPISFGELKNYLGISENDEELLRSFFTTKKPISYESYNGDGIRTRYFGHACILIETRELSILVDPVISYDGYDTEVARFTAYDLPTTIDYVLITHNHQDHILFETLLQIRHKIKNIIVPRNNKGSIQDPCLRLMLRHLGFKNILSMDDMETLELPLCKITGFPFLGEHADLDIASKLCYCIELHNDFKIVFMADSCNIEPMVYKKVHQLIGDIDVFFLGMECDGAPLSWLYGPLMFDKLPKDKDITRRLAGSNFDQGLSLLNNFNPKAVFIYAMGLEPWLRYISSIEYTDESRPILESNKLINTCLSKNIIAERLFGERTISYSGSDLVLS